MKRLLILLTIVLALSCFVLMAFVPQKVNTCPVTGDNTGTTKAALHHQQVDSYKNRGTVPKNYMKIDFSAMSGLKVDNTMSWDMAVYVDGYVLEIQDGGLESCNCHSKDFKDTHIYLVQTINETNKSNAIIVEATPRFRATLGSTNDLKRYIGKHVRIYGYLFRDDEHKANSTVDEGNGNHWRHSVWEIHPITKIEAL